MPVEFDDWWKTTWSTASRSLRSRDFAEKHVKLAKGPIVGPLLLANNPALGPILDVLDDDRVREVALLKAVQTGGSLVSRIFTARSAWADPCQMLLVLPSKDSGRDQIKKYWRPLLTGRECDVLKQFQRRRAARGRPKNGNLGSAAQLGRDEEDQPDRTTYENIVLSNGFDLLLGYSGSVQSLASHPCKKVVLDEVDKYRDWDGDEAEPIDLARLRTMTFRGVSKVLALSTPTTELGQIWVLFDESDIKLYPFVKCPCCGQPIQLLFENLQFELPPLKELPAAHDRARLLRREPERVYLRCDHCNKARIDEDERKRLLATCWFATLDQGWQFHADGRQTGEKPSGTKVGIHFPQLASAIGLSIVEMAAQWIEADNSLKKIQNCKNAHHAQPFTFDQVKPAKGLLYAKCRDEPERGFIAPKSQLVPPWGARLLMTIDTQKDKFYWVVRAWGARMRSRLLAYGEAFSFDELTRMIDEKWWHNEDPTLPARKIWLAAIDSGGGIDREHEDSTRTEQVYRWCAADRLKRLALKGVTSKKYETMTRLRKIEYKSPRNGDVVNVNLMWVNPLDSGDNLASFQRAQFEVVDEKTGELLELKLDQWELNRDVGPDYLRHHDVMQRKIKKIRGRRVPVWEEDADGARHDLYDCERYQIAIAHDAHAGLDGLPTETEIRARAAVASQPPITASHSDQTLRMPDGRAFLANRR